MHFVSCHDCELLLKKRVLCPEEGGTLLIPRVLTSFLVLFYQSGDGKAYAQAMRRFRVKWRDDSLPHIPKRKRP